MIAKGNPIQLFYPLTQICDIANPDFLSGLAMDNLLNHGTSAKPRYGLRSSDS